MLKDVLRALFPADCDLKWTLEFWDGNLYEPFDSSLAVRYLERFQESFASTCITWHDLLQLSIEPFQITDATIIGVEQSAALDDKCFDNREYDEMNLICYNEADVLIDVFDAGEWTVYSSRFEHMLSLRQYLRDKGFAV